jgi:hypothetical protein
LAGLEARSTHVKSINSTARISHDLEDTMAPKKDLPAKKPIKGGRVPNKNV